MPESQPYLAMYLAGPMQAWGYASRYNRRTTLPYPTRSGLIGLLMAALGASRDDAGTLNQLSDLTLEVVAFRDIQRRQRLRRVRFEFFFAFVRAKPHQTIGDHVIDRLILFRQCLA